MYLPLNLDSTQLYLLLRAYSKHMEAINATRGMISHIENALYNIEEHSSVYELMERKLDDLYMLEERLGEIPSIDEYYYTDYIMQKDYIRDIPCYVFLMEHGKYLSPQFCEICPYIGVCTEEADIITLQALYEKVGDTCSPF